MIKFIVNWIKSIIKVLNRLTGVTDRRNRALGHVSDWAETVNQFLKKYNLYENVDIDRFLEDSGNIRFELTLVAHNGRSLLAQAGNIKNKQVNELVGEILDYVESIRRYLFSPAAQKEKLRDGIIYLRLSCEKLQKNLAEIKRQQF